MHFYKKTIDKKLSISYNISGVTERMVFYPVCIQPFLSIKNFL